MSPNAPTITIVFGILMTASPEYLRRWIAWTAQYLPVDPLRREFGREWREEFYY